MQGIHQKLWSIPKSLPSCKVSGKSWFKVSGNVRVNNASRNDKRPRTIKGKDGWTSAWKWWLSIIKHRLSISRWRISLILREKKFLPPHFSQNTHQINHIRSNDVSEVANNVNQRHTLRPYYGRQHFSRVLETNIRGDIDTKARQDRHGDG